MAGKNQVTLTFAGDSSSLERSMDRVGGSAKRMGDDSRDGFGRVGDAADTADTRAMGFRDTITGFQDLNRGLTGDFDSLGDQLFMIGMGFGDLASGLANFGVEFAKQVGTFIMNTGRAVASHVASTATMIAGWAAQAAASIAAGAAAAAAWLVAAAPVILVIAAIAAVVAAIVLLIRNWDTVKRVAGQVWDWITAKVGQAAGWIAEKATGIKNWIVARFNDVVSFVSGLPGRISNAASGMWDGIKDSFRDAINAIIGWWNNLSFPTFNIPEIDPLGSFGPSIGGGSIGGWELPNIPTLHEGGMFRAPRGQREGLAMLLDGETVSKPGQGGGNVTIVVNAPLISSERELMRMIEDYFRRGGFGGLGL